MGALLAPGNVVSDSGLTSVTTRPLRRYREIENMDTLTIIESARDLLEDPKTWVQGQLLQYEETPDGVAPGGDAIGYCLLGAIGIITGWEDSDRLAAIDFLLKALKDLDRTDTNDLVEWQDNESRTHEQILGLLDHAITMLQ